MDQQPVNNIYTGLVEAEVYTFRKVDGKWYAYLPGYVEKGGTKQDLLLTEGAPKFLNSLAKGITSLQLRLSLTPIDGADLLELVELNEAPKGGGIYLFTPRNGAPETLYWICDLALLVFGDIPERIYMQQLLGNRKKNRPLSSLGINNRFPPYLK